MRFRMSNQLRAAYLVSATTSRSLVFRGFERNKLGCPLDKSEGAVKDRQRCCNSFFTRARITTCLYGDAKTAAADRAPHSSASRCVETALPQLQNLLRVPLVR